MSSTNHNIDQTATDWMRRQERRSASLESRAAVRNAADIMGPGLGPMAVQVQDWSDEVAVFNGILFSQPTALNSPDNTKWWIGESWGTDDGYGVQTVREYRGGALPRPEYEREFAPDGSGGYIFGPWVVKRQPVITGGITSTGPGSINFAGGASPVVLRKSSGRVWMEGTADRPSGSSLGYTVEGQVDPGFEPANVVYLPASTFFNSAIQWQWQILTNGNVQIRMSGANNNDMAVGGFSYLAATP